MASFYIGLAVLSRSREAVEGDFRLGNMTGRAEQERKNVDQGF